MSLRFLTAGRRQETTPSPGAGLRAVSATPALGSFTRVSARESDGSRAEAQGVHSWLPGSSIVTVGRFTAGCIAAVVAGVATVIAAVVEVRVSKGLHTKALLGLFVGVAGGVLWLGERYGLIADPYRDGTKGPLSLRTPPE
jgi:hypothetical protein